MITDGHVPASNLAVRYKILATAFAYPDESFFRWFQIEPADRDAIRAEYDRLFRAGRVWLEGAEYLADNEFHRTQLLADIMGFYRAFGVQPEKNRPDALSCQLEFMYYLQLKKLRAEREQTGAETEGKLAVCRQAETTFFREHLGPAATAIVERLRTATTNPFYCSAVAELEDLLESETLRLGPPLQLRRVDAPACVEWQGCAPAGCDGMAP